MRSIVDWFSGWSIRWKLQLGFFLVTMVTTIFNRLLAVSELQKMVEIAKAGGASEAVIRQLVESRETFIFNSYWESGLEFALQFLIIGIVAGYFVRPMRDLIEALAAAEHGDLTRTVAITSRDEIGQLEVRFNALLHTLRDILRGLDDNCRAIGQSGHQVASVSHQIADAEKREHSRSREVSRVMEDMVRVSEQVQKLSDSGRSAAEMTNQDARNGISAITDNIRQLQSARERVTETQGCISSLANVTGSIQRFTHAIREIAEKTNLLALNAAIEAARAGENGRGFAVVADEVRNLAAKSTDAAQQVSEMIDGLNESVREVVDTIGTVASEFDTAREGAQQSAEVIQRMAEEIGQTAAANQEISSASARQITQLDELQKTLARLFESHGRNADKVESTASIGDYLNELTDRMNTVLGRFRFDRRQVILPREEEARALPRLRHSLLVDVAQSQCSRRGVTEDLSLQGIQVRLREPLPEDDTAVRTTIHLPADSLDGFESREPLVLQARILRRLPEGEACRYGLEFLEVDHEQLTRLRQCFAFFHSNETFPDEDGFM